MIQSIQKCIQIMEYIAGNGNLVRIKDIADALGMKKTTVYNILETLKELEYIEQDEVSPRYRLTAKVQQLSCCYPSVSYMKKLLRPVLEHVTQEFHETSYLAVQIGNFFRYELKCEPQSMAKISLEVGKEYEMAKTAIGKVFVAYSIHLQDVLRKNAEQVSVKELTTILAKGYAWDVEEYEQGLHCIAIPCFCRKQLVAVLGMSGHANSFTREKMEKAAASIQQLLSQLVW